MVPALRSGRWVRLPLAPAKALAKLGWGRIDARASAVTPFRWDFGGDGQIAISGGVMPARRLFSGGFCGDGGGYRAFGDWGRLFLGMR